MADALRLADARTCVRMDEGVPVSVKKAISDHLIQLFGRRQFQWPAGKLHTLGLLGMNIGGGTQGFKVNGEERLLYRFRDLFDKDRPPRTPHAPAPCAGTTGCLVLRSAASP